MSYCLNPNCPRPSSNSVDVKFCTGCGAKLLLAGRNWGSADPDFVLKLVVSA